LIKTKHDNY